MKQPKSNKQKNRHKPITPLTTTRQAITSQAVALTYHSGMVAPQVVAKGKGFIAEEMIRRAQEAGVYVHESAELVALLMQVDLDERIPPELYVAVAELLAWLYRLENNTTTPSS